jgi:hypothetical protein
MMLNGKILLKKFEEILARDPTDYAESGNPEVVFSLHSTDWVRIFIVRQLDDLSAKTIDVEVSIPAPESTTNAIYDLIETSPTETKTTLEYLVKHIQYVLVLGDAGFSIDFVENGCLLLASLDFDDAPDIGMFELLIPPAHNNGI